MIVIADVQMTASDETYYVMKSRYMEEYYGDATLIAVEEKLTDAGWSKSSWITRADGVRVDWWLKSGAGDGVAVWDNDEKPYKFL